MNRLPDRPNFGHLKKQAKDLLNLYKDNDPLAFSRFREGLPAAAGLTDTELAALGLRLHDAQSCIAREYGFDSWSDLKGYVELRSSAPEMFDPLQLWLWLRRVYPGEVCGGNHRVRPKVAGQWLAERPEIISGDPYLACAAGDIDAVRQAIANDPNWVNRAGGPLKLPPLVAVAHSGLLKLEEFRPRLLECARNLLQAGADPNITIGSRWPPASLERPSSETRLSALYGPAGVFHDVELTRILLEAGATPNDNESLYHSLDNPEVTRALLDAGATIEGTNALARALDLANITPLRLLLERGANPNPDTPMVRPSPLLNAIHRRRSPDHVRLLLDAGANPHVRFSDGTSAYVMALRFGLTEIATMLCAAGVFETLSEEDQFVAACARLDREEAMRMLKATPELIGRLSQSQLRQLPNFAEAASGREVVKLMVELGWPLTPQGGDWNATALNLAVFRGDGELTRFLLVHGAQWTERHGYGSNVAGTLAWASSNEPVPRTSCEGDWGECARALVEHGMPVPKSRHLSYGVVFVGEEGELSFSEEVTEVLLHASQSTGHDTGSG